MIPVVLLKNFEPELWFLLAALFSMCLQESYFPDCLKVWSVVPVFNNVGWDVYGKKSCSVILLSAVSKVFGKLVNKSFLITISDFQYSFRSSWSAADQINSTHLTGFDILVFFINSNFFGFSGHIFGLILPLSGSGWEVFTKYSTNARVPQSSTLMLHPRALSYTVPSVH